MMRQERLHRIVELVIQRGKIHASELAARFGVSEATIRRDLNALEAKSLIEHAHGRALIHELLTDIPTEFKVDRRRDEKQRIARAALALARDAKSIGFTGGSTVLELATLIAESKQRTVITNALDLRPRCFCPSFTLSVITAVP